MHQPPLTVHVVDKDLGDCHLDLACVLTGSEYRAILRGTDPTTEQKQDALNAELARRGLLKDKEDEFFARGATVVK